MFPKLSNELLGTQMLAAIAIEFHNNLTGMNELPYINDALELKTVLRQLRLLRRSEKLKTKRKYILTKADRILIHIKTDGKCHICGQDVSVDKFEADHVKSHSKGGQSIIDNFLATCRTCNNYRWDYLPDEIKWVLKLGVWTRKQIEDDTTLGQEIAKTFVQYENKRENRRRIPRKGNG